MITDEMLSDEFDVIIHDGHEDSIYFEIVNYGRIKYGQPSVVASLNIRFLDEINKPFRKIWYVGWSKNKKPQVGYGAYLYEQAMLWCKDRNIWLTSDCASVSTSASKVWKKYYERSDVKRILLDKHDILRDGRMGYTWSKNKSPWLFRAYQLR